MRKVLLRPARAEGYDREIARPAGSRLERFIGGQDHPSGPMKCIIIHDSVRLDGPGLRESALCREFQPITTILRIVYVRFESERKGECGEGFILFGGEQHDVVRVVLSRDLHRLLH